MVWHDIILSFYQQRCYESYSIILIKSVANEVSSMVEKDAKIVSMIRKYHNHKPQATPLHRKEEPLNHHETPGRQIKQGNQLSLPHQDECNTRMAIK